MAGLPATSADADANSSHTGGDAAWRRRQVAAGQEMQEFFLGSECLLWEGVNNGSLQLEAEGTQLPVQVQSRSYNHPQPY